MKLQNSTFLTAGCFYCAVMLAPAALAQADRNQLAACLAITDNSARLACYDTLARPGQSPAAVSQTPAPLAAPAPPATPATPAQTTASNAKPATVAATPTPAPVPAAADKIDSFGQQKARLENDGANAALVDTVASIKEIEPRKLQITLANGQVWKQNISKSFLLRANDRVRITGSGWGDAFRLAKDGKPGYIQVERLR